MKRHPIHKALEEGSVLFDGATGTYAKTLPGFEGMPVELACLHAPSRVLALHRAYLDAGCRMIKTNTFAAHIGLAAADESQQREVIRAAYEIAVRAAQPYGAMVFADIGPAPRQECAGADYLRMAKAFLDAGADGFLFETLSAADGIEETAAYIKRACPHAYVAVSFAAGPDGFTRSGERVETLIEQMDACVAVDAVGLNCVCGAYHMKRLMERIPCAGKTRIIMPNAGYPQLVDGRIDYRSDPAYFAAQVGACAQMGAGIVGGCCGTTPAHIRMLADALARQQRVRPNEQRENANGAADCKSGILRALRAGKKPVLVELDPPRNAQLGAFLDGAKRIVQAGADAVTIADCPIGRARMDSSILACKLMREYGIECLPHMTCRDRNLNATKALLLGLSMEGVHNVLMVTGDPVSSSDRGSVQGVFQFHSRILARFVDGLSESGETEPFFTCGALNINAVNFQAELDKAVQKEQAGIQAFLTQPILSETAAENLHLARKHLRGYLFGGLFPIVSQRNAMFMDSEVAGVRVDPGVIGAYKGLDRAQGEALALRLCADAAARVAADVDGYYIMTPFQRIDLVERIVSALKA